MHKAKNIVERLLGTDSEQPDPSAARDIKEFVARRQSAFKNMENQFTVRNRGRVIAGKLLDLDIGRSVR